MGCSRWLFGHGPELLILDDPTLELDIVARRALYEEIDGKLADQHTTVFLTTHDLAGFEGVATRVGILKGSHLVLDESLESLKARFRRIRYANRLTETRTAFGTELDAFDAVSVRVRGWGIDAIVSNFDDAAFERPLPGDRRRRKCDGRSAAARGGFPRGGRRGEGGEGVMSGFLAIFRREFGGQRLILYAAGFASLIPLLLPIFRRMAVGDVAEARGWTALIVSAGFAYGLATALGSSMLVPRIATRRIVFDFARPVSGAVIWLGSLAAAVALALSTAAIVWIPALLAGARLNKADLFSNRWTWALAVLLAVAALPLFFSVLHATTLTFRSRSALLAFDALMLSLCVLGTSAALSQLPNFFAHLPRTACLIGLGVAMAVALLVSGQLSVSRGRIDLRAATALFRLLSGRSSSPPCSPRTAMPHG